MAEEQKKLPGGMAGITSYDVNPEKIRLRPEVVGAIVAGIVIIEALLYAFFK